MKRSISPILQKINFKIQSELLFQLVLGLKYFLKNTHNIIYIYTIFIYYWLD